MPESIPVRHPVFHSFRPWPRHRFARAAGLCLACAATTALANEPLETPEVELPPVTVSASRIPRDASEVPLNLTVLDRHELRESPALVLDDRLRDVPGFSLFRRSGSLGTHPTAQGVSLRGIGPSGAGRTLVLLDGFPLNDPFGGWVQWSRVPMLAVERVELVRGGGSTAWGNTAMGGVINIVTEEPTGPVARVEGLAGNRGTSQGSFYVANRDDPWGMAFDGRFFETDGYPVVARRWRGPVDESIWSRHAVVNATLTRSFAEGDWTGRAGFFSERRGNGTPFTGNETDNLRVSSRLRWSAGESGDWEWLAFAEKVDFSSRFSGVAADRSSETPALDQFSVPSDVAGTGLVWSREVGDLHQLVGGFDYRRISGETNEDYFFSNGQFQNRRTAGGSQDIAGLFLEDNVTLADDWLLTFGGRLDYWRQFDGGVWERNRQTGDTLRRERFSSRDGWGFHPRIGARHFVSSNLSARAAVYQAFRVPTVNELYRPFRVGNDTTQANSDLDLERLTGMETGLDFSGGDWFTGQVTAFHTELRDPVANVTLETLPGGGTLRQRRNLDRAVIQGFEVEGAARLSKSLQIGAAYLFSHGEVTRATDQPGLEGKWLAQSPRHQATLFSRFRWENGARLGVSLRHVGSQFEDDLNTRKLRGFWVTDVNVSMEVRDGLTLFAAVENLFDETRLTGLGADGLESIGAPRLFHGGARWEW